MIRIESVTKRFGRTRAVDGVTLELPAGDSLALWGANGAGKSTLIRCTLGLLRFSGRVRIGSHDVRREGKAARRLVGYVPQELGFYDDLRVGEAVGFFGRLKGIAVRDSRGVLEGVGLADHAGKRIRELSGGMKQRLALAIAMLGDPPVLVLDEVTASLDAVGRREFMALLTRLSGSGRTMLFASHRVEEVTLLARRIATLERGRIASIVDAREFGGHVAPGAMLRLKLPPRDRKRAIEALRAGGFVPRLNCVGILLPIALEHKAAPFRILAEARIAVDDFELEASTVPIATPPETERLP